MDICIFGDSITWGATDPLNGGWATLLRNYYDGEKDISVYNLGICGNTTSDLLNRFDVEAKARKPEAIIFAIGINDSKGINNLATPHIDEDKFTTNLNSLLEKARQYTKRILFIGLTPIDETKTFPNPWGSGESYRAENVSNYDKIIRDFCHKHALSSVFIHNVIELSELPDGLHPNSQGHKKLFEIIKPEVEKLIS